MVNHSVYSTVLGVDIDPNALNIAADNVEGFEVLASSA